ncbi:MAG: hypothetical protein R2730_15400 [Chitinophagales bacterium]
MTITSLCRYSYDQLNQLRSGRCGTVVDTLLAFNGCDSILTTVTYTSYTQQ